MRRSREWTRADIDEGHPWPRRSAGCRAWQSVTVEPARGIAFPAEGIGEAEVGDADGAGGRAVTGINLCAVGDVVGYEVDPVSEGFQKKSLLKGLRGLEARQGESSRRGAVRHPELLTSSRSDGRGEEEHLVSQSGQMARHAVRELPDRSRSLRGAVARPELPRADEEEPASRESEL